jgi:hypothetical protein
VGFSTIPDSGVRGEGGNNDAQAHECPQWVECGPSGNVRNGWKADVGPLSRESDGKAPKYATKRVVPGAVALVVTSKVG